jgi:hypothetical protein
MFKHFICIGADFAYNQIKFNFLTILADKAKLRVIGGRKTTGPRRNLNGFLAFSQ